MMSNSITSSFRCRKFLLKAGLGLLIFLSFGNFSYANNYYFSSSSGDDNYSSDQAQNPQTPWRSTDKLNSFFGNINAGDNIYFKRGDTFYGSIIISKSGSSGNPILISSYGSGNQPIITGFTKMANWSNEGGGIYSTSINSQAQTNMVTINDVQFAMGRYPDTGYLTFESFSNNYSITDYSSGSSNNWTNAEAVIRKNDYTIDRCLITQQSGGTIYYTSYGSSDAPKTNGFGYFIQNDLRTLTTYGEWYHNQNNGRFYMYFGSVDPNSREVKVATINNLIYPNSGADNIVIDNIKLTGSIDIIGNFVNGNNNCIVQNCTITFAGKDALYFSSDNNTLINNNYISNCNNSGVVCLGNSSVISNNAILYSGTILGQNMGTDGYNGVLIYGNNAMVKNNTVRNSGATAIVMRYHGASTVQYNYIDSACTLTDDGGGIYTAGPDESVRLIDHNIISNIIGNSDGTNNNYPISAGIFVDEPGSNITITNNTVFNIPNYAGIKFYRGNNNRINDNTTFNNLMGLSFQDGSGNSLYNNVWRRNILFARSSDQLSLSISTVTNSVPNVGVSDSNYYARPINDDQTLYTNQPSTGGINRNLQSWQAFTGDDMNSKRSPKSISDVNQINFQFNPTNSSKVISFSGLSYMDVKGKVYNNSATIPAWGSLILLPNGNATTVNKGPVVNAGKSTSIQLPTATTILAGSATDNDGTVIKYAWSKVSGPDNGFISNALSATTGLTNLLEGTYIYKLSVTDNNGIVGTDTVSVIVNTLASKSTLLPAVNPLYTTNGLDYKYYEGAWSALPAFNNLNPVETGSTPNYNLNVANHSTNFGLTFNGFIDIPADGQYNFYVSSDDGSALYIDNVLVVSNDGLHVATEQSGSIGLQAGKHTIMALYFQRDGDEVFEISYSGNNLPRQDIPSSVLYRVNLLPATNVTNAVNGLDYKYYEGDWSSLPSFTNTSPVAYGIANTFDLSLSRRSTQFAFNFTGFIDVPVDGIYRFFAASDDGSAIYIDGLLIVNNDGIHSLIEQSGVVGLKAGKHSIAGIYFQQQMDKVFIVSYQGDGIDKQVIPQSSLFRINNSGSKVAAGTNQLSTTSLNNLSSAYNMGELKLSSYPNPSPAAFNVKVEGGTNEKVDMIVLSGDGKTVFQTTGTTNKTYTFGESFMHGLYIVKIIQGDKVKTLKLIKI